ncbi:hypothetical protein E1B28_006702 [Marasmius oreades]|uniref:Uncharacterized protein n=1 Tax=Marasmius oreades TaxID=181124 RepID=A0A9P7UWP0_9AGAR|nr:uncharacterized protein E1B28_006702 [Marasmius oreades]KAG7096019.1 hypothetical protein E1B28_006702 [Marasmius oreades]
MMIGTKLFAAFTFASFGLVASSPGVVPLPVVDAIVKRDIADPVFTILNLSTDIFLSQLRQLATNGSASDVTVTPLIEQLTLALKQATSTLSILSTLNPSISCEKQGNCPIVSSILNTVRSLEAVVPVTSGLEATLNEFRDTVANVVAYGRLG